MGQHLREALPSGVQETRARLDAWRKSRGRGEPHPAEIWSEAVAWARRFGVNPVCRALGLSYTDLQKRLGQPRHEVLQLPRPVEPAFVELSMDPGGRMRAPGEGAGFQAGALGCPAVEVISADGARMVMRWPAGSAVDMGDLMASFLGRRR
jgi:hypothetical protein